MMHRTSHFKTCIIGTALTCLALLSFSFAQAAETIPQVKKPVIDPIEQKIKSMTLDQKIGQLLIVGFPGTTLDASTKKLITTNYVGGFNILGRNVKDKNQITALIKDMQKVAKVPLFMASDQEGTINRFKFLNEKTPQYQIKTLEQAKTVGQIKSQELKKLGVNMNFSPVLDYVTDTTSYLYKRTFATNPEMIGMLGTSMVDGYTIGKIIPVIKHFPGYGNILPDPHTNQAVLNITKEEFEKNLIPFKLVLAKYPEIPIMTAHIKIPVIDTKPATISSVFLTSILRNQLGAKGVIVTDDIEMISAGGKVEDIALQSIQAGADMVICSLSPGPEQTIKVFNRLKLAVKNGELSEKRIDESLARILLLKSKMQ